MVTWAVNLGAPGVDHRYLMRRLRSPQGPDSRPSHDAAQLFMSHIEHGTGRDQV